MTIFATGRTGTIGKFLSAEVEPISYTGYLSTGNLGGVAGKDVNLIHLGGMVGPSIVAKNPRDAYVANVERVGEFLSSLAKEARLSHVTYISTSHVYGKVQEGKLLKESSRVEPSSAYAFQKLQAEGAISETCTRLGVPFTILRLFSILGMTGEPFTLSGRLQEVSKGQPVSILKFSDDKRDFLSPSGAAKAIESIARVNPFGVFNLCTGNPLSIRQAATRVLIENDVPMERVTFLAGYSDSPWIVGSPQKLSRATGLKFHFETKAPL